MKRVYFLSELQFYLFVPPLVLIIGLLTKRHFSLSLIFIATLGTASFFRQVFSTSNAKHMILDGRIWQFLLGFLAHFAYNAKLIDWNISNGNKNSRVMRILVEIRNAAPIVLLFLTLTFDILDVMDHQIQRLVVVVLTALIVSIRNTNQTLLSSDILVHFGDVSYSTYLAHYPIFIMDRYLDNELYSGNKETGHISG